MRSTILLLLSLLMISYVFAGTDSVISESVHQQLSRVHELMDEARYDQALKRLQAIRTSKKRRYEQALVLQTSGYLYAAMEQYSQAIDVLAECLKLKVLPESARRNTLYTLAQLQAAVDDNQTAIETLEIWFKLVTSPSAQAHGFAGGVYARAANYNQAIRHLRKAIALAGDTNESWYRQLLAVYFAAENYPAAARLLQEMTQLFPQHKAYWLQLSSAYRKLEDDARSLAVLELAFQRNLLDDESELIELVNYYRYMDAPHKAAKLLALVIQDGRVSSSAEHWMLLSDCWLQAKEMHNAMTALKRAAGMAQQADWYLRLAQLAAQLDESNLVINAVDASLQLGELKQLGKALILKGRAHYDRQEYPAAKAAFEKAMRDGSVQDNAQRWLDFVASEMALANNTVMDRR